ncbi:MAG: TolC family protein, partial [bacterium]|nr:TolC family protein [bacterium]
SQEKAEKKEALKGDKKNAGKGEGLAEAMKKDKTLKLSVDKVVQYLLQNNHDVKQTLLEYKGLSSGLLKFQAQYDMNAFGSATHSLTETSPNKASSAYFGTSTATSNYAAGVSKNFDTGTSVTASIGGAYSNVESSIPSFGGSGYQTDIKVELTQELLKNGLIGFNFTGKLEEKKISNGTRMQKEGIKVKLAALLVDALVGYWNVAVAEENLATSKEGLRSTRNIRNLIARKMRLGLSEREDILDWNGKVLQGQNGTERAEKILFDARLAVLRVLDLNSDTNIEIGKTFKTTAPEVTVEQALKDAFLKRVDWNNQRIAIRNAGLEYKISSYNELPSLKLKGSVGNSDYDTNSYLSTFDDLNKNYSVGLELSYPLGNTAAETRMRDARLGLQKEHVALKKLEKEIRDEVASVVKECAVSYKIYDQTKKSRRYAQNYYGQVLQKFKRGRYSAVQLKLALDAYIQARY